MTDDDTRQPMCVCVFTFGYGQIWERMAALSVDFQC
jgi:hypothetical protein